MINLANYLNKTILISIPAVFEDNQPHPFKLVGIELFGLWLESEELAQRVQSPDKQGQSLSSHAVFFPFSQILYVVDRVPVTAHAHAHPAHAKTNMP